MAKRLTPISIAKIKPDPTKRIEVPDSGKPGLYLVVQPSGRMSWAVRYRRLSDGKPRKLTFDGLASLSTAHQLAQQALDAIARGEDPAASKQASKATQAHGGSDLFGSVAAEFIERHAKRNTRASSARETERFLNKEVLPKWGKKSIHDITKRDVLDLLDGIVDRGSPISANRVKAILSKLFAWSTERGILETSPVTGIKAPSPETSRDRVLSDDEVRWLWLACDQMAYPFGKLTQLLLLTGARRSEISCMTWGELDIDKALWTIPADRVKNGLVHTVPLSDAALDIIKSLPRIESEPGYLFTTSDKGSVKGFWKARDRLASSMLDLARTERGQDVAIPGWTYHDLRRTCASGMARLGINLVTIEKILNHTSGTLGGVAGIYMRYDFGTEKRSALEAWGRHVLSLVDGAPAGNIAQLRATSPSA